MPDYEVWEMGRGGDFDMIRVITADTINAALEEAYLEDNKKWKYLKKVKNEKKEEIGQENS